MPTHLEATKMANEAQYLDDLFRGSTTTGPTSDYHPRVKLVLLRFFDRCLMKKDGRGMDVHIETNHFPVSNVVRYPEVLGEEC